MKIQFGTDSGYTLVSNVFIDRYMPTASGEFVKVYLFLLRCASSGQEISVSSIADEFDHTEKDVLRALTYWEKMGLLKQEFDVNGLPVSIMLGSRQQKASGSISSGVSASAATSSGHSEDFSVSRVSSQGSALQAAVSAEAMPLSADTGLSTDIPVPSKSNISAARVAELGEQDAIRQLIFVGSQYKKSPLRSTEVQNLIYFYDELHFSTDLIEYLMEYCMSKGNPGPRYMEKVAQEWYKNGITTVMQAKENTSTYNKDYYTILKFMGIAGRMVTKAEAQYMDRWMNEYMFGIDLIEEACRRTVLATGSGSFGYADSILKSWHEHNVHTMDDVKREDAEHAKRSAKSAAAKSTAQTGAAANGNGGQFGRFPQREYNWNELEAQLLAAQSGKGE